MRRRNYKGDLNRIVDYAYDLRSTIEEVLYDEGISIAYVIRYIAALGSMVGCLIGASAGLGLSFTALSPLVIGGVIAAVFPALLALVFVGACYYFHDEINELKEEASPMEGKRVIAALMAFFIVPNLGEKPWT